jgi:hypothetical protein
MIKIEVNNIEDIAKEFLNKLKDKKYLNNNNNTFIKYWISNMDRIVLAKPDTFEKIIAEKALYGQEKDVVFKKYMKGQYETMNKNHGYWLAEQLNIKCCPYCNRQYTFTINNNGTKTKPQFDHFYSKSEYPCLALSFYNLIPSCPTCNHIKGEENISINPYIEDFQDNNCKFQLIDKGIGKPAIIDKENIEVDFSSKNKNIEVFGLRKLYSQHTDYVGEIIDKAQAYNATYYDSLIQSFSGLGKTSAEIDRFVWGSYLETAEHGKRPLSKLTHDVLEQIGINTI